MSTYLHLEEIRFTGPGGKEAKLAFAQGVNVICGASDTGKSFLAEAIDFMLGGSSLKEIPERVPYASIALSMGASDDTAWKFDRGISGGDFVMTPLGEGAGEPTKLKQSHGHEKVDNISGFLLDKIGLLGKRILKSARNGTTVSLSFRNLARLIIIQEGEIQQSGSPFWGGQFTLKTAELATLKLLLTGVDDSSVISASDNADGDNSRQLALIDELISELTDQISEHGATAEELNDQLSKLDRTIEGRREELTTVQKELDQTVAKRREVFVAREAVEQRLVEIEELLVRFALLDQHYDVDKKRLQAISEEGSLFIHFEQVSCPLCGAAPNQQHTDTDCDGNVGAVVEAANAEILKIEHLSFELHQTVSGLKHEASALRSNNKEYNEQYDLLQSEIAQTISPQVADARANFQELLETKAKQQKVLTLHAQVEKLLARRESLINDVPETPRDTPNKVAAGIPESTAHALSQKIEGILRAWNFPGQCRVHFDKEASDFVIDGKPRGSRGKGLRAITHAAVTLALLEYCQEHDLPHPGFVVMDSPLLAYFKPEGDEDTALQGTDLKERFYNYLIQHHGKSSQIIIIENQHPPESVDTNLAMTVFTRNPADGRFGLL
ncbi:MAG: hypothetical protein EOQ50_14125 [Mesorhizobium sp.]|uniref:hypothetical protein n=1 Tax=Mesorhizobium sp. TaxID=1871066 RepID=UPI000FE60B9F|nr:hypothetical protein [Mesorhizobium sp.]RWB75417.1 MAG: hypothetical protein EOQ50_14125 [Mesorhizobium sp.]